MSITVHESAVKRIEELRAAQDAPDLRLRITVDGGGCSGFQYLRELTRDTKDADKVFGDVIITDVISLPFLNNAVVKFESGLIGSDFVIENPNALSGCGCGTSFSV